MGNISIQLILLSVFGFIMLVSLLVGLKQGFRKNMYNFFATVAFWIVFWITAPLFKGRFILNGTGFFNLIKGILPPIESGGIEVTCLLDYLKISIGSSMGVSPDLLGDPAIANTLIAIIHSIFKIVWLLLLWLIWKIARPVVYNVFFKKYCKVSKRTLNKLQKKQEKYIKKNNEPSKKLEKQIAYQEKNIKRNKLFRPLGLASGFVRGFLACFLILFFVNSTVKIFPQDDRDNLTASNEDTPYYPSIYDFIVDYCGGEGTVAADAVNMIRDYQNTTLFKMTGMKLGNRSIDEIFVDSILSGKSKDYSFVLRKELKSVVQIAENAYYLTNGFDMESVQWTALSNYQVQKLQNVLKILADDDLVNNLGTAMIGIAISLDSVAEYMPSNVTKEEYNIDWHNELENISKLVGDVYKLSGENGDLAKLDYFALDEELVENIFVDLSKLQSINFLAHIGVSFAIKSLVDNDPAYAQNIASIEAKLANMAVKDGNSNNTFGDTLYSYKDLYASFITLFNSEVLDKYKDENGQINNYVAALTSIDTNEYSNIIHTILEANFAQEILPDVLTIIKGKMVPVEYASLINPSVVSTLQWEKEIDAVLKIIHDLTTDENGTIHPFESIEKYDFSLLRNFSTNTVVNSDLLSYAIIKLFIDTSENVGVLSENNLDLANYIKVPDNLAKPADPVTHRFDKKWYGYTENGVTVLGELEIMLETLTSCAAEIEDSKHIENSIPNIIRAIPANHLMDCDVLYYSVNNMLKDFQNYIIVPKDETHDSEEKINGATVSNVIDRDSLRVLFEILTDSNIIDYDQLFGYYKKFEEGGSSSVRTPKEDIPVDEFDQYELKIDLTTENIMNLLTSKKLYDPNSTSPNKEDNLKKLFSSSILRTTITYYINSFGSDFVSIPQMAVKESVDCLVLKENEETGESSLEVERIDVINENQFKTLIMAVCDLEINLNSLLNDPMSIVKSFQNADGTDLKSGVNAIFGNTSSDDINVSDSKYSAILHASLSKYILDFSNSGDSEIGLIVPEDVLYPKDTTIIKSAESVNLIRSLTIIGTDAFVYDSGKNQNELINDIVAKIIDDSRALDSRIIRATLTNYLKDSDNGIAIPEEAYEVNAASSVKVVSKPDIYDLLVALDALKDASDKPMEYYDLMDVNNLSFSMLKKADAKNGEVSASLIIRGILTDQIEKKGYEIPRSVIDGTTISQIESQSLIKALCALLGEDSSVTNIDVDSITVGHLKEVKDDVKESTVVRKILTDELSKQDDITIPLSAVDEESVILPDELDNLVVGLDKLVDSNSKVDSINVDDVTLDHLDSSSATLVKSVILRATMTTEFNKKKDEGIIVITENAYDSENILTANEITSVLKALSNILGDDKKISEINGFENIGISNLYSNITHINKSLILRGTISKELLEMPDIRVPKVDIDTSITDYNVIKTNSLEKFFIAVNCMEGVDSINAIDGSNITVHAKDKAILADSNIVRATITVNISFNGGADTDSEQLHAKTFKDNAVIEKDYNNNDILILTSDELEKFIEGISIMSDSGKIEAVTISKEVLMKVNSKENGLDILLASGTLKLVVDDFLKFVLAAYGYSPESYMDVYSLENYQLTGEISTIDNNPIYSNDDVKALVNSF